MTGRAIDVVAFAAAGQQRHVDWPAACRGLLHAVEIALCNDALAEGLGFGAVLEQRGLGEGAVAVLLRHGMIAAAGERADRISSMTARGRSWRAQLRDRHSAGIAEGRA